MKSIIPTTFIHFSTHVLMVVVIFQHSECAVSYDDDVEYEVLPTYCCSDFEDAVLDVCGEDNYDIDWYSGDAQDCCILGCSDWALSQLCITPPVYPIPTLPTYCCDDLEEAVSEVCGENNYYPIDYYSPESQICCYLGCDEDDLSQFCIDYNSMHDPASSLTEETDPSLMSADSEELMETNDQSLTKTTTSSLMSAQTENYAATTDPTPTTP
ncbi:uncharacterized protein LOC117179958 [Belonocnema kinseyi]|uniref:uncharacterized protein LOC117179958 n=1 Tax=Belonocnema kinseyi TaxID=2817044 RepID=UPI00143D05AC|nr:uncharacterized protein LOC117179958 [Belonocnema kinseyi]